MEDEPIFDLTSIGEKEGKIPLRPGTKLPNYNYEGQADSGFGDSKYDDNFYPDAELNKDGTGFDLNSLVNERRSAKQPSLLKAGTGVLRAGSKALQEIAKMPGVLGGIVAGGVGQIGDAISGEDNTDFIKTAFDNKWVQTINEIGETINKEALPVYVSKAVTEGNLWDNISSIDFWATEGADGLGYIVSMLAPGAAISKLGVGSKIIQGISKFGKFNDKTVRAAEKLAELGLPTNAKNIDLYSQTLANTLFEAGAEAQGAMESYKMTLDNELAQGKITQAEYDVRIQKQSEIGRNVFVTNAAILVGPNAIMSKMLWGKARNKIAGKIVNEEGVLSKLDNPSILRKAKLYGDDFGKATLREGFFEEGLQSTAETYFTENPDSNILDLVGDLPQAYADMVLSTEGQKAILLGGVFGGGMQAYTGGKSRKKERETTNNLIDLGNSALSDMYNVFNEDVYEKDENGEIIYENDKPKVNYKKVQDKLRSQDSLESLSALYDVAIENNDTQTIEQIKDLVTTNLVKPFIVNDELGIDVLKQHLELSKEIEAISEREKKDKNEYINDILKKAEKLQTDYNSFQDYASDLINLKNGTDSQKVDFYNKLSMQYLDSKSREYYLSDKLKKTQEKYNELIRSKGVDLSILENNAALERDLNQDSRVRKTKEDIKNLQSSLEAAKKTNDSFWDGTSVQGAYDIELAETEKVNEDIAKNTQKTDDVLTKIKDAKTQKDLDEINADKREDLSDKDTLLFDKEKEVITNIKDSITKDPSLKNIELQLNKLKNLNFQHADITSLINKLERRIEDVSDKKAEFKDSISELILEREILVEELIQDLDSTEKELTTLLESKAKVVEDLKNNTPSKIRGRNSKLIKQLIKETKLEISKLEFKISQLEKKKSNLESKLATIQNGIGILYNRYNQVDLLELTSPEDIISYINDNIDDFQDHKFELSRLKIHEYYTKENIKGLEDSIEKLEDYKEVLEGILKRYEGSMDPDTMFLDIEYSKTTSELKAAKKTLQSEKDKLGRLIKAANDKQVLKQLNIERDFWNSLNTIRKKRNISNPIINEEIKKKSQEIKETLVKEKETVKESNKEFDNTQNIVQEETNEDFDYVANNFNEEEVIELPKSLGGGTAIINKINPTNIVVEDSNGELKTITKNQFDDKNPSSDYNTEGTDNPTVQTSDTNQKDNPFDKRNESKIITVDSKGKKLSFVSEAAVEFERTPRNKVGESKGFEINPLVTSLSDNQNIARDMYLANDFSDKIFLVNHLPINVKLTDDVVAPIETLSDVSDKYNAIFAKTTKVLRKAIVEELAAGNKIEDITSEIAGQWNGQLQLEEEVLENNIADLYEFASDVKKIKSTDLYVVDDMGNLKNTNDDYMNAKRALAPGEIYLKVHMANGKEFPLKLNIKKVSQPQAELLYELYKYRFEDINEGKSTKIIDTNDAVLSSVKEVFAEEIKLFEKNKRPLSDLTIKDVVDFIIWDGTKSPKSQVRFLKGKLLVAGESYTAEDFNKDSAKEDFIYTLTTQKRNNIKFKRRPAEGPESMNFQNRSYVEYLINNNILNTNAKVNTPTFAGVTNMYLAPDKVKVKGKLSKFNKVFKTKETTPPKENAPQVSMGNNIDFSKLGLPVPTAKPVVTTSIEDQKTKLINSIKFIEEVEKDSYKEYWTNTVGYLSSDDIAYNKKNMGSTKVKSGINFIGSTKEEVINKINSKFPTQPVSDNPISQSGLAKLGLVVKPTSEAKPEPKKVESNNVDVENATINSFRQPNNLLATGEPLTFDKQDYVMTKDFYVVNVTTKRPVTDLPTILKYVDAYNKATIMKSWKLDKNNVQKIWNSRLNVVPLQDNIKKEEMSKENIQESLNTLLVSYPIYTKDLMKVLDKIRNESLANRLQAVVTFLKSKNISQQEIETKCKS